jgi:nitrite reductase (NO-forming)
VSRAAGPGRGFQPLRDLPAVVWLASLTVVAMVHPWVPAPRWLMLHLLLLGAVSHSILVWSQHFADALLHTAPTGAELRHRTTRLALHNCGAAVVIAGALLETWTVTLVGAASVAAAAGWHAAALIGQSRGALPSRFAATVGYYVVAACHLPLGATLGVLLARGAGEPLHERMLLAHVLVNVLGWVGLTVLGTLLTLWPTMLRTRIADGAERTSGRALPVLVVGVAVSAVGALAGVLPVVAAGVAAYLAGMALLAPAFVDAARRKPPHEFPTWSVLAGVVWLVVLLAVLAATFATAPDQAAAMARLSWGVPFLAAGFAAQVLLGALSYLVPVALRGGPTAVREATAALDRGSALRVVAVNAGLVVLALPAPSLVRMLASVLVLGAFAAFLPLLVAAIRASRRARAAPAPHAARTAQAARAATRGPRPPGQLQGLAAVGLAGVVLAVAAGVALDPLALTGAGRAAEAGVAATGETTTVRVEAADMRFHPGTVRVPAGNRLVIELVNTDDEDVHDLVLDTGDRTPRLAPGAAATLDAGVVGRDLDGWCSVVGHRQMGMLLTVEVTGAAGDRASQASQAGHTGHDMDGTDSTDSPGGPDLMAEPDTGFRAADATLPPLPDGRVHEVTLTVTEVEREVTPGHTQTLWTYDGSAPGPVLHGRVGDVFEVTLVNDGTIGHSVDFHAGTLAPDRPMRTIRPGKSLVYRFTATRAGIWMYHCSTMPMSAHIGNGMYGAVVVEPPGLPEVDRSYVLVQSEMYLGDDGEEVDVAKVQADRPDLVVFNGYANQYAFDPLPARVGERVRLWVLDAGPNRFTSFHVVGGMFDTVYAEGAYRLGPANQPGGSQALSLGPAQGGFVELTFPEAGTYPFLTHAVADAERGARGLFRVQR